MNKRVLIIDESQSCIEKLTILFEEHTSLNVDVTHNYNEAVDFFNRHVYENIIIDHNCRTANPFMDYILEKKPSQRVILLSDTLNCPINCNDCLNKFKFVRLLKPINFKEVLKFVNIEDNFECPNKYRFENIDTLEKLFTFLNLDNYIFYIEKELKKDKILIRSKSSDIMHFNEVSKLEDFISSEFFTLDVQEDFTVMIRMKKS